MSSLALEASGLSKAYRIGKTRQQVPARNRPERGICHSQQHSTDQRRKRIEQDRGHQAVDNDLQARLQDARITRRVERDMAQLRQHRFGHSRWRDFSPSPLA